MVCIMTMPFSLAKCSLRSYYEDVGFYENRPSSICLPDFCQMISIEADMSEANCLTT